jgi:hypothetical protein
LGQKGRYEEEVTQTSPNTLRTHKARMARLFVVVDNRSMGGDPDPAGTQSAARTVLGHDRSAPAELWFRNTAELRLP